MYIHTRICIYLFVHLLSHIRNISLCAPRHVGHIMTYPLCDQNVQKQCRVQTTLWYIAVWCVLPSLEHNYWDDPTPSTDPNKPCRA